MSATRSQDEYNKIIPTVDIFVMLFWTKVGKYTNEEFDIAKILFNLTQKPKIIVYQKAAKPENIEQSLTDCLATLNQKDEEYFCGQYEHTDTLKFKIYKELDFFYNQNFALLNKEKQESTVNTTQIADKIYNIENANNSTFN